MAAGTKPHHQRKHRNANQALKVVMVILAIGVVLAVVVGLLVLMNNPAYEGRQ